MLWILIDVVNFSICHIFQIQAIQKFQYCQLCVLRENSIGGAVLRCALWTVISLLLSFYYSCIDVKIFCAFLDVVSQCGTHFTSKLRPNYDIFGWNHCCCRVLYGCMNNSFHWWNWKPCEKLCFDDFSSFTSAFPAVFKY